MATAEQSNQAVPMTTRSQHQKPVLRKMNSWSPDSGKEDVWRRRKKNHCSSCRHLRLRRTNSNVTDEDLDELKACIELGFGFDPDSRPDLDPRLSDALPALGLYCAVNKQYNRILSRSASSVSSDGRAADDSSSSPAVVVDPSEDPETVKMKLRQWARVVACSVKQFAGN